jgi:hypothetical protein
MAVRSARIATVDRSAGFVHRHGLAVAGALGERRLRARKIIRVAVGSASSNREHAGCLYDADAPNNEGSREQHAREHRPNDRLETPLPPKDARSYRGRSELMNPRLQRWGR